MNGKIIQYKELFTLTCNIIVFEHLMDNTNMIVLRTGNQDIKTNIIKHCFKNCCISFGLYRFLFIYSIGNHIHFQAKKIVRTQNKTNDTLSKSHISDFKTFIAHYHSNRFDNFKHIRQKYVILLGVHNYFDLMID